MEQLGTANVKVMFGLTLVHFIGDFYISFINPLLPVFVKTYSLTLTQVGLLAGISRLFAFLVQPSAGYIADHYRTRFFILGGPLLTTIFIPLTGTAPSFLILVLFVSLGSIGSSMFHPTTAGMVSTYSGRHFGLSMSIFNMGGTLAFGVGPFFITCLVASFGLRTSPITMALGLAAIAGLSRIIPIPQGEGLRNISFIASIREVLGTVWKSIILIWLIMVLRAIVSQSFLTFIPVHYSQEGYSLISIGTVVSLYTVAGAMSGLLAGHLSDRIGSKPIFYVAHALTAPCLYLLLYLPGTWIYLGALLAGFSAMATLPLGVTMALQLAPKGRSMVSSLMMGLVFGTAGMTIPLVGKLADIFSIRAVLLCIAVIPLLTTGLIYFLPAKKRLYYQSAV